MSVPGSNLLAAAFTVITPQPVTYRASTGRTTNAAGLMTPTYAAPVTVYGSFQAVNTNMMAQLGLDMSKRYAMFYASRRFREPDRGNPPDAFTYDGRRWIGVSGVDWYAIDGWDSVLVVDSGPEPAP